ncbi:peptide deformylase [Elizabethkingia anophelis]|uniref:peptide deformylase n=1 Tax=Elizabethkingia anophelis TaxID=1117645 RepID=UPI0020B3F9B0|nr:peptide deformylase [Elizabethkingia anophelis]MDV3957634.1 peptide deformylase [Elizabethkingia anophelis]UTF92763.1 peptide deformylase [Elizabethkingia anophelis]
MILPIIAYGHNILKQKCSPVAENPDLNQLIKDMWETMQNANGCGLAAPQIGQTKQLFIVDSTSVYQLMDAEDREHYFESEDHGIKETFINARITDYSDELWDDYEGCLSIPGLSQKVRRPWSINIEYLNADLQLQQRSFSGATARTIQHEYDHTQGVLYLDHLKPLTRKLMETKLRKIKNGKTESNYPVKYLK